MTPLLAFLRRDGRESRSYLTSWVVDGSGIVLTVLTFYFLGRLIDRGSSVALAGYGSSYFGFAVNGIAMAALLSQAVRGHSRALRRAQLTGTLEPMLLTPVPAWQIAVGGALGELLRGLLRLLTYLGLAAGLGALVIAPSLLWLPLVLLASTLAFLPFGLLSASYTLLAKRGDPIAYLTNAATLLLAGVYFPPSVLPGWLQPASALYPVTHAVAALRSATLGTGAPLAPLLRLGCFTLVALPLSAWLFERSVRLARRTGDLGQP